jgi:hypothetical protein
MTLFEKMPAMNGKYRQDAKVRQTTLIAAIVVRNAATICPLASLAARDRFSP